jgi:hypothetical protein
MDYITLLISDCNLGWLLGILVAAIILYLFFEGRNIFFKDVKDDEDEDLNKQTNK